MKIVETSELEPGMIAGETINNNLGQPIVCDGDTLNEELIIQLSFYKILNVQIKEPEDIEKEKAAAAANAKRAAFLENNPASDSSMKFMNFQIEYARVLSSTHEVFDFIIDHPDETPDLTPVLQECVNLTKMCDTVVEIFDSMHNMRLDEDSVYSHCLNVAIIARVIGRWLNFSTAEKDVLTLCGLFHDIGKINVPETILNKPGKYMDEEFEYVKKHPRFGFDILKTLEFDDRIKKSALQHHEFCDGSGYPQGLKSDEIEDYANIIAIADVYDAMTAARSYRSPLCPFQAISVFERDGLQRYRPQFIMTFLKQIAMIYQHNRVLLSSGQGATIVMINTSHLTRPMVQLDDGSIIDMLSEPELEISKII